MSTKRVIPKFNSEAEEAEWWYENREWLARQFQEAAGKGELQVLTRKRLLDRLKQSKETPEAATSLTVPLSEDDLAKIHSLAQQRRLDDADLAAELLSEALRRI